MITLEQICKISPADIGAKASREREVLISKPVNSLYANHTSKHIFVSVIGMTLYLYAPEDILLSPFQVGYISYTAGTLYSTENAEPAL